MTKYLLPILLLLSTGCYTEPHSESRTEPPKPFLDELRVKWELSYATQTNEFTSRTYECISEMYSLIYNPPNAGPVCKEACKLHTDVNKFVDQAPAYVENPKQYTLPPMDVCKLPRTKRRKS